MNSRPLVSFIMPARNPRADWLELAARSVLEQQACRVELIVCDDGSEIPVERTLQIRDPRVRIVRIEHSGSAAARNIAFEHAQGDYIRFVDCDDYVLADSTLQLQQHMETETTISYGATVRCDENLRPRHTLTCVLEGNVRNECFLGSFTVMVPAMLFPRFLVQGVGGWDEQLPMMQDWDFVLRVLDLGVVRSSTRPAYHYRIHRSSSSHRPDAGRRYVCWRRIIDKHLERHPELVGSTVHRRAEAQLAMHSNRPGALIRAIRWHAPTALDVGLKIATTRALQLLSHR